MNILSSDPCTASDQNSTSGNSCISLGRQILPSSQLWSLCVSCLQVNIVRNLCIQMAIEDSGSAACHWIAWLLLPAAAAAWNRKLLGSWLPIISGRGWGGGGLDINPQHLLRILHQIALFLFQKAHRLSQWWAQFENRPRAARLTITASCGREVCKLQQWPWKCGSANRCCCEKGKRLERVCFKMSLNRHKIEQVSADSCELLLIRTKDPGFVRKIFALNPSQRALVKPRCAVEKGMMRRPRLWWRWKIGQGKRSETRNNKKQETRQE